MTNPAAPTSADLSDWLAWLETLSPREIVMGLSRVETVLQRLDLPRPRRILSVAGTNGKGSTVAMLASLYAAADCKVASYTSPHVIRFNERMRVDGRCLSDTEIVSALAAVASVRGDVPLTYFEFGTLAALTAFARAEAQIYVLEVGLGGRLDAVNAVDPDGSVICNVALDHCDWLGSDIESIAGEKAGIMRKGVPVIYGAAPAPRAIERHAHECGAELLLAGRDFHASAGNDAPDATWTFRFRNRSALELRKPSLAGAFQVQNAAAALALYTALENPVNLDANKINAALTSVELDGRLQRIGNSRQWLLDVAHNPAAAEVLGAELARTTSTGKVLGVIGVLADKDFDAMLRPLLERVDEWIAVTPDAPRALPAIRLAARLAELTQRPCRVAANIGSALDTAAAMAAASDLILVTGSFYTVGPALQHLGHVGDEPLGYTRGAREPTDREN